MSKSRMSKTCSPLTTRRFSAVSTTPTDALDGPGRAVEGDLTSHVVAVGAASPGVATGVQPRRSRVTTRVAASIDAAQQLGVVEAVAGAQPGHLDLEVGRGRSARCHAAVAHLGVDRAGDPTAPNVIGPTDERASISTTERSGTTRNVDTQAARDLRDGG